MQTAASNWPDLTSTLLRETTSPSGLTMRQLARNTSTFQIREMPTRVATSNKEFPKTKLLARGPLERTASASELMLLIPLTTTVK
jgi:hypothetical protein